MQRTLSWCLLLSLVAGGDVGAQTDAGAATKQAGPKSPATSEVVLTVSPQALPTPLLRYRLLPASTELNPGDAAPVYLRLDQQVPSETIAEQAKQAATLLDQPLADFPVAEGKQLIERWARRLQQIEFGARRQGCHWDYTTLEESDDPWSILLPDAQAMRPWSRLLAVKARVEVGSGRFEDAVRTLETGVAFGRHVAEGPFFISKLVGMSMIGTMLDRVDEWIGQPGAPNLYWALTALPQPLVEIREATENERAAMGRALTGQRLEEVDVARPRSDAEWSALLTQLHARIVRAETLIGDDPPQPVKTPVTLEAFRAAMLPQARDYLRLRQVAAASDDQVLVLALIGLYREQADEHFLPGYLPFSEVARRDAEFARMKAAPKSGPASIYVRMLPSIRASYLTEARLARRIAALRVVEALRLHAATHDGALPESLDQVQTVPIPIDPVTGKPFEYRRDGASSVLTGPTPTPTPGPPLVYRITVRK